VGTQDALLALLLPVDANVGGFKRLWPPREENLRPMRTVEGLQEAAAAGTTTPLWPRRLRDPG